MDKNISDIIQLITLHLMGALDDEKEKERLKIWRSASVKNEALFQKICSSQNREAHEQKLKQFSRHKGWLDFQKKQRNALKRTHIKPWLRYVAILALPLGIAYCLFWFSNSSALSPNSDLETSNQTGLTPGEAKAIITLDTGEKIFLDKNNPRTDESKYSRNLKLDSATVSVLATEDYKKTSFSTIETPVGGEFQLILADNSRVYLNAQTKLRFPDQFSEEIREIELLEGEIFLDVEKQNKPFVVKTPKINILVLGTSFNLSTYDNLYQTTLVSGAVKITSENGEDYHLSPSQQATYNPNEKQMEIKVVDTELYTSWRFGKLIFKDQELGIIMNTLSLWYDFKIEYANEDLKKMKFGFNLNKYKEITPLLKLLEETKKVKITVEGDNIYIDSPTLSN